MKKFSSLHKGFTLVELMIVIAIIGILAAVLYPAMTGYFERSRDTNRQGALRNISLSLAAYNTDNSKNPDEAASGGKCTDALKDALAPATGQKYINSLPVDPKNGHGVDECKKSDTVSGFGYKTLSNGGSAAASYALSANMETKGNANISEENYKNYTTIEDMGKAQKGNTTTLPADTAAGKWYYVVAQ